MTVTARQVNTQGIRVYMGTITDKHDIHEALTLFAQHHNIRTATVEMLGGLHQVELTAYDFHQQIRLEPLTFSKPMEIVAGHGTISQLDNTPHVHIHMTLAFRDPDSPTGIRVIGGHVARSQAFAVEFTLTAYDGEPVQRAMHANTGLKLWKLPLLNTGD